MAILKNVGLKTSTIDEIKDNFDGAQGVVVVNYSGLTVCLLYTSDAADD